MQCPVLKGDFGDLQTDIELPTAQHIVARDITSMNFINNAPMDY